ncbi:MAG: molybdopterin-dependent oxidoreductase [Dehalococcoidia bacterium]|nr:molybdopterin-dependent oxidoreductase [Dehalococcoidia bacterium]
MTTTERQTLTLTVNGAEIRAEPGQMLIQAANEAGVYIPYLCYHPGMKPYGACRMCVVEVEGAPGTPAACTLPVRDGMVVNTLGDQALGVRDAILDLLLSEHPHGCLTCHRIDLCGPQDICLRHVDVTDRCVTCPKNERCELKDTTRFHTQGLNSPLTYQYRGLQIETQDPFYDRDYNLCIVCARCVRACEEVRGDSAITMTERAGQVLVGTSRGESLLESGCEFCGLCIDVCPVGALVETDHKWERAARYEQTVCAECPVGCQLTYEVNRFGKVIRAIGELNGPANQGNACYKGKFGFEYVNSRERVKQPLVRRNGSLEPASWEEAAAAAAEGLAPHKGTEFALVASPRNTNEELYLAQKFARIAMQSNNVDSASNDRPGLMEGMHDVLGQYAGTASVQETRNSACVLVVSANVTEEQNVLAVPVKQAVRAGEQRLIVIDARETELTRYAHLWLRPYPGTDLALIGGMLKVIVDEGLTDREFVDAHCDGFDAMAASLAPFALDAVAAETGVPAERVAEAARLYAQSAAATTIFALDNTVGGTRRITSRLIADLALITGNVGKPAAGLLPLRHGANDQGQLDVGAEARLLPGHRHVADAQDRAALGTLWGAPIPAADPAPLRVREAFAAARKGEVKAMLVLGDHVHYEDGTLGDTAAAFEALEFLVVSDTFLSPAAQRANVVFPAAAFSEKRGTFTNMERRVQPLRQVAVNRAVDARSDLETLQALANALGAPGFDFDGPEAVLDEIAQAVPQYAGVSYRRLIDEAVPTLKPSNDNPLPTQVLYSNAVAMGVQWPCPAPDHPGTPHLAPVGRAQLAPAEWRPRPRHGAESPESQGGRFPLLLAQGRVLAQPEREVSVHRNGGPNQVLREEELTLHPADAALAGLTDGQAVRAVTAKGAALLGRVRIAPDALEGVASATTLFGEFATALDASEHPDPMNHAPRLAVLPARIEPTEHEEAGS